MTTAPARKPLTSAERQARRREQFNQMRAALEAIRDAASLKEAKAIAVNALPVAMGAQPRTATAPSPRSLSAGG